MQNVLYEDSVDEDGAQSDQESVSTAVASKPDQVVEKHILARVAHIVKTPLGREEPVVSHVFQLIPILCLPVDPKFQAHLLY